MPAAATPTTTTTETAPPTLPPLPEQARRLVDLGVTRDSDLAPDALLTATDRLGEVAPAGSLLVVHPRLAPPSSLAHLLRRDVRTRAGVVERDGFVVGDFGDVDDFTPPPGVEVPEADVYAVAPPHRGDHLANASPEEAAPALEAADRSPLTLTEGVHWLLQYPAALEPNHCFMTIGSRLRKPDGTFDARTPALWISGGTGRDGAERRGAVKVGWCWWRNRHTWLGFASTTGRYS